MEMPRLPPTLRSRLYRPEAFPISSFDKYAMVVVDKGTKTIPEANPLRIMAHINDHGEIARVISPNQIPQMPKMKSPPPINLSLIHISEPTRQAEISYAVF